MSMPAKSASRVVSIRRRASSVTRPTATVRALSPKKPSTTQPRSRPTMSPSFSLRRSEGMPCTTSSLMDTHRVAG
jgi:hypothetical protein